jgi:hypothetical protein
VRGDIDQGEVLRKRGKVKARFLNGPLEGNILDIAHEYPILDIYEGGFPPFDMDAFPQVCTCKYRLVGAEFPTGILLYRLFDVQKLRDFNSLNLTKGDRSFLRSLRISTEEKSAYDRS